MATNVPTFIGYVASVMGGSVRVRLKSDLQTSLVMIEGESYRVGQIGAFLRIPLGYSQLFGVCTLVGADAAPPDRSEPARHWELEDDPDASFKGFRWLTLALFGESLGRVFERGVSQFPTVGDEVHLVTARDLDVIYGSIDAEGSIDVGTVANSSGIAAKLNIAGLVSRHCAIVGSTGSGKSTLVSTIVDAISAGDFPTFRTIIIDPHGEYSAALSSRAHVFKLNPDSTIGEKNLWVPYWALAFHELQRLTIGELQGNHEAAIREIVREMKVASSVRLKNPVPAEAITADAPIPFNIRKLWHDLDEYENRTYSKSNLNAQDESTLNSATVDGDPISLKRTQYPPATSESTPPYPHRAKRNINRQLEFMRGRLSDSSYSFLLNPGGGFTPALDGSCAADIDSLVADWIGHDQGLTILDVSEVPSDIRPLIVGTMLRLVYNCIYWGMHLSVGGRNQPLLVIVDEAHLFAPANEDSDSLSTLSMIAKEGRKYGVGLIVVTQRPSELASTILSQVGTMVALRITNTTDASTVSRYLPDDLGSLAAILPALRTGEAIFLGEAMSIPTRVRIRQSGTQVIGADPPMPQGWKQDSRPNKDTYADAITNWRRLSMRGDDSNEEAD